jgi:hypothetical protein
MRAASRHNLDENDTLNGFGAEAKELKGTHEFVSHNFLASFNNRQVRGPEFQKFC